MQQIAPCLMFAGEQYGRAEEAMLLYVSLFEDASVLEVDRFDEGESERGLRRARFQIAGREFIAMDSGGEHAFSFTPALSLVVEFEEPGQLDTAFAALSDGGAVLMPLQGYPFSAKFGWCNDRFGVSWQLRLRG